MDEEDVSFTIKTGCTDKMQQYLAAPVVCSVIRDYCGALRDLTKYEALPSCIIEDTQTTPEERQALLKEPAALEMADLLRRTLSRMLMDAEVYNTVMGE